MKRRTGYFLLLFACIALMAAALTLVMHREPRYRGKPLSEWLAPPRIDEESERIQAVQQIGRNALPFLVNWLQYEPSYLRFKLEVLCTRLHIAPRWLRDSSLDRRREAVNGFLILGHEASSAIPTLASLTEAANSQTQIWAIRGLCAIGKDAVPTLVDLITNAPAHPNINVMAVVSEFSGLTTNELLAKPAMLAHIADENQQVAIGATLVLGEIGKLQHSVGAPPHETLEVIQALRSNLKATNTLVAEQARFALQSLLIVSLSDPNISVRIEATNAMNQIAPELLKSMTER